MQPTLNPPASDSRIHLPGNDSSSSTVKDKKESACADHSGDINPIDEGTRLQQIRTDGVQGQSSTDHDQVAEVDTNQLFDELFMLLTDDDLVLDQIKWVHKGYLALCDRKTEPSTEPEFLVRKAMPSASMPSGLHMPLPPPVHRVRSLPSGASTLTDRKEL